MKCLAKMLMHVCRLFTISCQWDAISMEKREKRLKHFSLFFLHLYLLEFLVWVHENDIPGTPAYGFPYLFLLAVKLIPLVVFLPRTDFPEISLLTAWCRFLFSFCPRKNDNRDDDGGCRSTTMEGWIEFEVCVRARIFFIVMIYDGDWMRSNSAVLLS